MTAWESATNLGNILIRRGWLSPSQLAEALQQQQIRLAAANMGDLVLLGEVCVSLGYLTQEQLQAALVEQKQLHAPAHNASAVDDALDALDLAVSQAKATSTKFAAVSDLYVTSILQRA